MPWSAESTSDRHGFMVTYLRSKGHGHEGAHEVSVDGRTIRILPGGPRSSSWRSRALTGALETIAQIRNESLPVDVDPVELIVGVMVVGGVTEIEIDGVPLIDRPPAKGQWTVQLLDDGRVEAAWLGDD